MDIKQILT